MIDPKKLLSELEMEQAGTNLARLFFSLQDAGMTRDEALAIIVAVVQKPAPKE